MRSIIKLSLRLKFLLIISAVALFVFGVFKLHQIPVDVYPEFNPPLVEVQTEALGLSAEEVEALITVPLEADLLNGVAWLEDIYSESVAGLSSILLVFEPGTDHIAARQMVQERLTQAHTLPNVSKPPVMLQPLSATSRVMMVGLTSSELSLIEMGVLARWNIKPRLMGVPGVANVAIWGQRERQLQVQVDPKKLRSYGVTLQQVIETTGEALWFSPLSYLESSTPGTAGWIDTPNQRLSIRHELPISSPEDLAKVTIVDRPGLLLGKVAQVVEGHQPLIGDAILDNSTGLLLVIEKFPGSNTLEVTRGVEKALEAMRPGLTGVEIDTTIFRPANYIELAIDNLGMIVLISSIFIVSILIAFFWQWYPVLNSLVAIPLSMVAAAFILYLRGATFNIMILAGLVIAFPIIIDDAIVDVENIVKSLRHSKNGDKPIAKIILEAVVNIRSPLSYTMLMILLSIAPVFFMEGLSRAFFQPLAESYLTAVITSLLVALSITPALALILTNTLKDRKSPLVVRLERYYDKLLTGSLKKPRYQYVFALTIVIVGLATLPFLKTSLLPSFKQTDILIEWEGAPGTSRDEMNRITTQVSHELKSIDGVKNIGAHVGRAITGDAVVGINSAELWLNLAPDADYDVTLNDIQEVVDGYPGLFKELSTYQPERVGEALMEKDVDIAVRIYGHDLSVLQKLAEEGKQIISEVEGIADVWTDLPIEKPQVEIEVDLTTAERYQVKPGEVRRQVATLLSGLQVGNLYEQQKVFDVVVWGVPEIRDSLTDISELVIDTPRGQTSLGNLADIRIVPAPIIIKRDAVSRFIDIEAKISGRDLTPVTDDISHHLQELDFPLEYHAEILGTSANITTNGKRMISVIVAAMFGIFLLMQTSFSNWRLAFLNFATLPFALIGSVLAAFLSGRILSLGSFFGLLAVFGITVRNSNLLINHLEHLRTSGGMSHGQRLIVRGAKERLTPITMSALTTGLALFPIIIAGNIAGSELLLPMAIVILGGLFTSIYLVLFVIPVLYLQYKTRFKK